MEWESVTAIPGLALMKSALLILITRLWLRKKSLSFDFLGKSREPVASSRLVVQWEAARTHLVRDQCSWNSPVGGTYVWSGLALWPSSVSHPAISSSVVPFCLQSFPASRSFSMSQFFRIRWPKYWSFSFGISPSDEYSGLISFRIDCFDQLYVYIYPSLLDLPSNPICHPVEFFKSTVIRKTWLYFYTVIIWTIMINIVMQGTWVIESDERDERCGSQGSMSSKDPSTKHPDNSFVYSRYERTTGGMIPSIL